ncbi:MAG: hypothetical protein CML50_22620 [Rhodobacteraceae bacterium]|jgi:hypothetical protein|uniref:Uncharacterized protein n=1 Tax=Salipiger profundus TaxID=1229727 RepID=A0A1U7CZP6_9RHOB|nr:MULTISPECIES: hypothetical protein [Salipiger]APX21377.1 hypothetical protein Ga0080559_TMP581 [Salipiger profundus]MAB08787.1 hypothetical protein [Paracoccaceae bacterium]GGA02808.1 hypothetical protein GCM10011326_12740 [Salipiger profundus]SFC23436.1 hypothetical protein SAMN05444415_102431 [Salipiger profundus]
MKSLALAALLAAAPVATLADTLTLAQPRAGGTLHTNTVDMSVYRTDAETDGAFEVVARYIDAGSDADAAKTLRMRLEDGDSVAFGLPGHSGTSWSFTRAGDALTVTSAPLYSQLALN